MTARADHSALSRRIACLSGEKRQLLRKLLVREDPGPVPSYPVPHGPTADEVLITRDALSGHEAGEQGKRLYELVNQNLDRTPFAAHAVFLNLGYVANENPRSSPIELPKHCLNRNCMQLALEVIADVDLGGREVADVGCGRGGAIALMKTYFSPRQVVGVDFSRAAIAFCRWNHRFEDTHFVQGNAQELPLASARFEVVTNIESASGYPDIARFYREVFRVLRPGGYFLYADVVSRDRLPERRRLLTDIGLLIRHERDVTPNVLLSCDDSARIHRAALAGAHDDQIMGNFFGLPDSTVYRQMKESALAYLILKMQSMGA